MLYLSIHNPTFLPFFNSPIYTKSGKDLGSEYLLELLSDNQLNCSDLFELFDYIKGDQDSIMGLPVREIINYIKQFKK